MELSKVKDEYSDTFGKEAIGMRTVSRDKREKMKVNNEI